MKKLDDEDRRPNSKDSADAQGESGMAVNASRKERPSGDDGRSSRLHVLAPVGPGEAEGEIEGQKKVCQTKQECPPQKRARGQETEDE